MRGSEDAEFKRELKAMIIEECDKDLPPEAVPDDAPLFGDGTVLQLDSVDGLQISMALLKRYGVRVTDSKDLRRILVSVNTLADFLRPA